MRTGRILACSGDWLHVEVRLTRSMKPLAKTDAPAGAVRGWTDGTCASETTPCGSSDEEQRKLNSWSPPAPSPPE